MDRSGTEVEQDGAALVLRRRAGASPSGGFLLIWLVFWTFGCVMLAGQVVREPTLQHLLFGVPFWASWAFVACVLARTFFGREWLRVGPEGVDYRSTAVVTLRRRHVPLREVTGVGRFRKVVDGEGDRTEQGLRIETLGRPVLFGQGVDDAEWARLTNLLLEQLRSLSPGRSVALLEDDPPPGPESPPPTVEVLGPSGEEAKEGAGPPSDSRIRARRDGDRTVFVRRGAFRPANFGLVTFLNLFWNGIVGVFVVQALREGNWHVLLFVSLHAIVGVALFLLWWAALLAPLGVRTWAVGPGEVVDRFAVLGVGRARRYGPGRFVRVELRRGGLKRPFRDRDEDGGAACRLALIGPDGKEALTLDDLTEGEARWIGAELARVPDERRGPTPAGPGPLYDRWLDSP